MDSTAKVTPLPNIHVKSLQDMMMMMMIISGGGEMFGRKEVKLSLCLTRHHAMKAYRGSGGITPRIL
jgi:hypothetical protein